MHVRVAPPKSYPLHNRGLRFMPRSRQEKSIISMQERCHDGGQVLDVRRRCRQVLREDPTPDRYEGSEDSEALLEIVGDGPATATPAEADQAALGCKNVGTKRGNQIGGRMVRCLV